MPPRYSQKISAIHDELRKRVLGGEWKEGDKLPTETELAAHFECSVGTISKAMALLAHAGLVERRARAGTRVIGGAAQADNRSAELDAFAFIYPSEQHEGIWRTVKGFQEAAHAAGRRVVMLTTGTDYRKETEYITRLSEFRVRGAVVYPNVLTREDQVAVSQLLVATRFPIVLSSVNLLGLGCPAVTVDAFHAGYTMTCHLLKRGLKKIGYFANRAGSVSMRDRYLGYRKAMEEAGLTVPPEWIFLEPSMTPDFRDPLREPSQLAQRYLDQATGVEGVVCNTDFLAVALIRVARERGLRVPEDLKVTGIDDYALASAGDIALTTYRVPCEELGRKTFAALEAHLAGTISPAAEIQIRGEIVVRQSA